MQGLKYAARSPQGQPDALRAYADAQLRDVEDLLVQRLDHTTLIANREPLFGEPFDPRKLHEELMQSYRGVAQQKHLAIIGTCADVLQ
jgi:hypothetical protein